MFFHPSINFHLQPERRIPDLPLASILLQLFCGITEVFAKPNGSCNCSSMPWVCPGAFTLLDMHKQLNNLLSETQTTLTGSSWWGEAVTLIHLYSSVYFYKKKRKKEKVWSRETNYLLLSAEGVKGSVGNTISRNEILKEGKLTHYPAHSIT